MKTFELSKELIDNISDLILNKNNKEIKKIVKTLHYADLAELINELKFEKGFKRIFRKGNCRRN